MRREKVNVLTNKFVSNYVNFFFTHPVTFFIFQWVPEISHHCQKTPFLLVGTQIDLRDDAATIEKLAKNKQKPLTQEMGEKLAKELRAVKYVECSALTQVSFNHKKLEFLVKNWIF